MIDNGFSDISDHESFVNGVPVFCNEHNSSAKPIAETDFTLVETPKYEDRELLFHSLAYCNYTMEEMKNGTAWRILNEKITLLVLICICILGISFVIVLLYA